MKIAYFLNDNGAQGYYRAELPFTTMSARTPTLTYKIQGGQNEEHIETGLIGAEIVFIPRMFEPRYIALARELKKQGKKVVTDLDDNPFAVSPLSDSYKFFGTEEVQVKSPDGKILPVWVDGYNIDLKANREKMALIKMGLREADLVTTTTDILAGALSEFNDNIKVLPNCLDLNLWKKLSLVRKDANEIRLFWAGGSSHYEDWVLIAEPLKRVMDKYPNVKLVLLGEKFDGTIKDIDPDRIEFHPWVPTPAYPYKVAQLDADIGMIPLHPNLFSVCKSNLKWIEMSALEVPCVASYVSPYKEWATKENGVWIEDNDPDAWVEGLSLLIEDKLLRSKIAGEANRDMKKDFDIETQYQRWLEVYGKLDAEQPLQAKENRRVH